MQKLFYVVGRWLEEDNSRQSTRIADMIKDEMQKVGFNYESISNTEKQREQLYREREKLIREKQKLEEQKRQIELQRQHNIRLIEEKQKLQREREMIEQKLNEEKEQAEDLKEENQELEQKRKTMVEEYQKLQDERDKIIEERQLLFQRMEKIEKLQRLQKMYQEELRRLREEAEIEGEKVEEEKAQEEEQNQIEVIIPTTGHGSQSAQDNSEQKRVEEAFTNKVNSSQSQSNSNPVTYSSGLSSTVYTGPPQYTVPVSFSSQQPRYVSSTQYARTYTYAPQTASFSTQTNPVGTQPYQHSTGFETSQNLKTSSSQSGKTSVSQGTGQSPYSYYVVRRGSSENQENQGGKDQQKK